MLQICQHRLAPTQDPADTSYVIYEPNMYIKTYATAVCHIQKFIRYIEAAGSFPQNIGCSFRELEMVKSKVNMERKLAFHSCWNQVEIPYPGAYESSMGQLPFSQTENSQPLLEMPLPPLAGFGADAPLVSYPFTGYPQQVPNPCTCSVSWLMHRVLVGRSLKDDESGLFLGHSCRSLLAPLK